MFYLENPCPVDTHVPEVIAAIGAVIATLVGLVLVHLRLRADARTKEHREEECAVQEAIIAKLGIEIKALKRERRLRS